MADWRLERADDSTLSLYGALKFSDVMAVRSEVDRVLEGMMSPVCVDFSNVTKVDSSALSLWLCTLRKAESLGIDLTAAGVPEEMSSIARLVGLERYFD